MDEFSLINKYLAPLSKEAGGSFHLTNDAAVFLVRKGYEAVITKDAITEGVHFLSDTSPSDIIKKLIRVNISDIAAMGALPKYYLIAAILPDSITESWFKETAEALAKEQKEFGISLIGGDTVSHKGKISLSMTMIGEIKKGKALKRTTARKGDFIYVSGTIGDASLGLAVLQNRLPDISEKSKKLLIGRYKIPQPRIVLGQEIVRFASAAIDVSDGMIADFNHMKKGAVIEAAKIPLSDAAKEVLKKSPELFKTVMTGGDDYELLFTAHPGNERKIASLSKRLKTPITRIGVITGGTKITVIDSNNKEISFKNKGFRHF